MHHFPLKLALVLSAASVVACGQNRAAPTAHTDAAKTEIANTTATVDQSEQLNLWLEEQFEATLARSPQFQTFLGRKTNYDKWNDVSDEFRQESHALRTASLAEMTDAFDIDALNHDARLSYRLYKYTIDREEKFFPFRNHWYVFSAFRGPHSTTPAFLINQHRVDTVSDAHAYIKRLEGFKAYLGQHQKNAEAQYAEGISPPDWSFPKMIATAKNVISGAPFDDTDKSSAIFADVEKKINALDIDETEKTDLLTRAEAALLSSVKPAYDSLIAAFEKQATKATGDDGAWKLPDGDAYYTSQLERMTTTTMSAQSIHDLGLSEVERIHGEMDAIKDSVGFNGSLQEFFTYMRDDPDGKFTYPNTDKGRDAYLKAATDTIDIMRGRLDELFYTKPKASLTVKRVEPFREKSAGKAFYQRPAPDGSRPGYYYANLYDMANMPTYQLEALAYHEGIPGHHMQIAISQELDNIPSFRKYGGVTAFSEGWGLYSEYIPKEMGFYSDPYSDFGRLAMELWRAARLVVDTGLHYKKWTREDAIAYLQENTPNPNADTVNAIERYIAMPGQATAYKIGMLKILELRSRAENSLGGAFDIRAFHDVILANGPVPLDILEGNVDAWIDEQKKK